MAEKLPLDKVHMRLCQYDRRNPDYFEDELQPAPRREDCFCDNCFYGRTVLANEILRLADIVDDYRDREYEG